jgi:hypothetical protein
MIILLGYVVMLYLYIKTGRFGATHLDAPQTVGGFHDHLYHLGTARPIIIGSAHGDASSCTAAQRGSERDSWSR